MIEVSAGIIRRADGQILICQRGEGRHNAHLWEFPGGKREPGESAAQCLIRELGEELSLPVHDVQELCVREAEGIRFTFLTCETDAEPVPTEHEAVRFIPAREMLRYPFCPADTGVARELALNAPKLRHFLWDFDGTLVDSYPGLNAMLLRACREVGIETTPGHALDLQKNSLGYAVTALAAEHELPREVLQAAVDRQNEDALVCGYPPLAGIPETLKALIAMGGRHYLVTHRGKAALECLAHHGLLELFTDTVTKEDGFPRKPAPDSVRHLLDKHHIDPMEAVMIGDRPLDTAAGRSAGILSCLLDVEGRFPEDPCELRAASAEQLVETLCPEAPGM